MAEEVPEDRPREIPCNIVAASAIIPASTLLDMLFRELVAAKRANRETAMRLEKALDLLREEKLKA